MDKRLRCFKSREIYWEENTMFHHSTHSWPRQIGQPWRLLLLLLLGFLISACAQDPALPQTNTPRTNTSVAEVTPASFPATPPSLRTPEFGGAGQVAPTVKVLASVDPTLIIQFPLFPAASIKSKFPNAKGLVTVFQNPKANDFDVVTVNVENMPPHVKFTIFLTESSSKPFGHGEYIGDLITRDDGSYEATLHLIAFVAFAADARQSQVTSADQSGTASGIQLEHLGMWFDEVTTARRVLGDPKIAGTPFDGGHGLLHAGPQAMTDGQALPVL
jgi:hypothetical protein